MGNGTSRVPNKSFCMPLGIKQGTPSRDPNKQHLLAKMKEHLWAVGALMWTWTPWLWLLHYCRMWTPGVLSGSSTWTPCWDGAGTMTFCTAFWDRRNGYSWVDAVGEVCLWGKSGLGMQLKVLGISWWIIYANWYCVHFDLWISLLANFMFRISCNLSVYQKISHNSISYFKHSQTIFQVCILKEIGILGTFNFFTKEFFIIDPD